MPLVQIARTIRRRLNPKVLENRSSRAEALLRDIFTTEEEEKERERWSNAVLEATICRDLFLTNVLDFNKLTTNRQSITHIHVSVNMSQILSF